MVNDLVERDHHDLSGQDKVRGNGRLNQLVFGVWILCVRLFFFFFFCAMCCEVVEDLLCAFKAQISTAAHENGGQRPRRNPRQQQRDRQDDDDLVDERALGDAPNDRQLAGWANAGDVLWGNGGIVNHDACRLYRGLAS